MEKNIYIYNEMRAAAERVFNDGVNAPAGVYSLDELAKVGTTCKTAPAGVYFREEYDADELININVDGFECSYPARLAFVLAYKFERLAKVGTKACAAFQRVEDHGEPVEDVTEDSDNAGHVAPVEDVTEDSDNADTLDVAPVSSSNSIQATEYTDNADTLDVAPVAPDNINQMQGTIAASPLVASCSTSAVYPTYYEALEALGRYRPNAKLAERINGAGEAKNY